MARPKKQGIDYFSLDVDFFSDIKVRKINRACGAASTSVLICLLCNVYKDEGYYILWDEDLPFVIADTVGVSEGAVKEVIQKAIQVDFFNKELFEKYKILTSEGIQKRFRLATYQRRGVLINPEYEINNANNSVSCTNNPINHMNNPVVGSDSSVIHAESTQSKVNRKESKVNKEKIKKKDAAKAATLVRKTEFYEELIPYVETYGKDMIRAFFDYWSEMNKSETKMRFEQQKTWEISLRLKTWASRDSNQFNKNSNGKTTSITNISGNRSGNRNTSSGTDAENKRREREHLGRLADAILQQSAAENRK